MGRDDSLIGIYAETFPALLLSGMFALIPGFFLSLYSKDLSKVIGLLTLIPAIIGMRGNVFGSFCAHMSSLHHINTSSIEHSEKNDKNDLENKKNPFNDEISARRTAAVAEVLLLSIILPVMSYAVFKVMRKPIAPFQILLFICITSGISSGCILLFVSLITIQLIRNNGLDPDNIAPPIVTTLGDVITLPIISFCSHLGASLPITIMWSVNILGLITLFMFLYLTLSYNTKIFWSTLYQRLPVLMSCLILSSIAGLAMEEYLVKISSSFLFFVPLINAQGGNAGSIFASRISSGLYIASNDIFGESLATIRHLIISKDRLIEATSVIFSLICVFQFIGVLVIILGGDHSYSILPVFGCLALCLGIVSEITSIVVTLFSILCGMNPDNIVIACVCAFMDLFGTYCYGGLLILSGLI